MKRFKQLKCWDLAKMLLRQQVLNKKQSSMWNRRGAVISTNKIFSCLYHIALRFLIKHKLMLKDDREISSFRHQHVTLNRCGIQGNRVCFISLTGYYYKQNMLHSAVNVSFNLLIFFSASPVKIIFHDPSSISFPKYLISLQYNKAKKKKNSQVIYRISLSILF